MNSFLKSALVVAVMTSVSGMAQADTFSLSGTFGTSTYTGPLNGGSFSGSYEYTAAANGGAGTVGAYDIFLRDADGTVLVELSSAMGMLSIIMDSPGDSSQIWLTFYDNASYQNALSLYFAKPFSGAGAVVPGTGTYVPYATVGGFDSSTISLVSNGMAVAAVPEPATWGLMGLGLLAVGAARRRKAA